MLRPAGAARLSAGRGRATRPSCCLPTPVHSRPAPAPPPPACLVQQQVGDAALAARSLRPLPVRHRLQGGHVGAQGGGVHHRGAGVQAGDLGGGAGRQAAVGIGTRHARGRRRRAKMHCTAGVRAGPKPACEPGHRPLQPAAPPTVRSGATPSAGASSKVSATCCGSPMPVGGGGWEAGGGGCRPPALASRGAGVPQAPRTLGQRQHCCTGTSPAAPPAPQASPSLPPPVDSMTR